MLLRCCNDPDAPSLVNLRVVQASTTFSDQDKDDYTPRTTLSMDGYGGSRSDGEEQDAVLWTQLSLKLLCTGLYICLFYIVVATLA